MESLMYIYDWYICGGKKKARKDPYDSSMCLFSKVQKQQNLLDLL